MLATLVREACLQRTQCVRLKSILKKIEHTGLESVKNESIPSRYGGHGRKPKGRRWFWRDSLGTAFSNVIHADMCCITELYDVKELTSRTCTGRP